MKTLLIGLFTLAALFPAFGLDDDLRQALYGAIDSARDSIRKAPFDRSPVAILPIPGDDGTVRGRLKNHLTAAGFTVVEGKEDPMWDEILKEIAWDERKDDILDPATLVKFGRLKAARILVYARINQVDRNSDRVYGEIELHATNLTDKRHIWGGNFAYRYYRGNDVRGIVELNNALRMLLKKNFSAARESMQSPDCAARLAPLRTVTVIPLAGDIDQYLTGLAIEALTMTSHTPRYPQIPSLSQVRAFARDGQVATDGIFHGAVRDLSRKPRPELDTLGEKAFEVNGDIQLFLERISNGDILWSRTITIREIEMVPKNLTTGEKAGVRTVGFLEAHATAILIIVGVIVGILALGVAIAVIRSATNVR